MDYQAFGGFYFLSEGHRIYKVFPPLSILFDFFTSCILSFGVEGEKMTVGSERLEGSIDLLSGGSSSPVGGEDGSQE